MRKKPVKPGDISMCDESTVVEGVFVFHCSSCGWKETKMAKVSFRENRWQFVLESCPKCGCHPLSVRAGGLFERMIFEFFGR